MKSYLNIDEKEKVIILEMYNLQKKNNINEQNKLLNISTLPFIGLQDNGEYQNGTKTIYLSSTENNKRVVYSYNIKGGFAGKFFDVIIKKLNRNNNTGELNGWAQIENKVLRKSLMWMIPKKSKDKEGNWLYFEVPKNDINKAIDLLKKQSSATINAGSGVTLTLTNIGYEETKLGEIGKKLIGQKLEK
jgi:hypothetical protein